METPSTENGLSLTLSWGAPGARRRRTLSLGSALRVGLAVALCVGCYKIGRVQGSLEDGGPPKASSGVVIVERDAKLPEKAGPTAAPGMAVGENTDVITPLNVRDPSALVMAPYEPRPAAPAVEAPKPQEESTRPAHVFPRPSGKVKPDRRF